MTRRLSKTVSSSSCLIFSLSTGYLLSAPFTARNLLQVEQFLQEMNICGGSL